MAEVHTMTVDEIVSYFAEGEGVDLVRESLRQVCQQLMEAELSELPRLVPARECGASRDGPSGARETPLDPLRMVSPRGLEDGR